MHKAVLKNRFFKHRLPVGKGQKCHHLSLQICRKARMRLGCHIHGGKTPFRPGDLKAPRSFF
ncbi:MAG: hypothetical protein AAGK09_10345, partial [Planctomycetota bacterium]